MSGSWNPNQLREWHEQVMDFMILQPTATYEEIAGQFGVHPGTVSVMVRSDLFQARLRDRRAARQATVEDTVLKKLRGLAEHSIDAIDEKLKREKANLGLLDMTETAEMALRGLGYIDKTGRGGASAPSQTNVQLVVVSADHLAQARDLMRRRLSAPEGELLELPASA